jgi:hypothetical protein
MQVSSLIHLQKIHYPRIERANSQKARMARTRLLPPLFRFIQMLLSAKDFLHKQILHRFVPDGKQFDESVPLHARNS